jgi:hypothetical protein
MSKCSPYKPLGHRKNCKCPQCKLCREWEARKKEGSSTMTEKHDLKKILEEDRAYTTELLKKLETRYGIILTVEDFEDLIAFLKQEHYI